MSLVQGIRNNDQVCEGGGIDRISSLPSVITKRILQRLPLEDAVRMSILSRYWRHQWVQLPDLILNMYFLKNVLRKYMDGTIEDLRAAFLKIVNNILLRHVGHIRKFELYFSHWVPVSEDISQWIQFLSSKAVQELTLSDFRNDYFVDDSDSDVEMYGCLHGKRLPSCLFSSVSLKHLTLSNCCIYSLPSTFSGFPCLISLYLHNCCMVANTLQTLIASSPQLENLSIYDYMCLDARKIIYTPSLRKLVIRDFYCDIRFQGNKVSLNLDWQSWKEQEKFFSCCFSKVETLILGEAFWRDCLLKDGLPIPNQLGQLKSLKLVQVPIQCHWTMSYIISLLGNCQKLQKLQIIASRWLHLSCRCKHLGDMVTEMMGKCSFRCLNNAALIISMTGLSHELQLIKLLLACSRVLEVMTIEPNKKIEEEDALKITKELLGYSRASTNAKIVFKT